MDGRTTITVFDVGFGDCIHVITPSDIHVLIDTGREGSFEYVSKWLSKQSYRIDYILLTHEHSDHIAGLIKLFDKYPDFKDQVKGIYHWIMPLPCISPSCVKVLEKVSNLMVEEHVQFFSIKDSFVGTPLDKDFEMLYPHLTAGYCSDDKNENSIILSLRLKDYILLFMGDAPDTIEKRVLSDLKSRSSSIDLNKVIFIKIGHHGSDTSSSQLFIENVVGEEFLYALCSCKNSWDSPPPSNQKIKYLNDFLKSKNKDLVYCTGHIDSRQSYRICFTLDKDKIECNFERFDIYA